MTLAEKAAEAAEAVRLAVAKLKSLQTAHGLPEHVSSEFVEKAEAVLEVLDNGEPECKHCWDTGVKDEGSGCGFCDLGDF